MQGIAIGEGGIDRDSAQVDAFLAWLAAQSAAAAEVEYVCTRHDAAVILELVAGWWPTVG